MPVWIQLCKFTVDHNLESVCERENALLGIEALFLEEPMNGLDDCLAMDHTSPSAVLHWTDVGLVPMQVTCAGNASCRGNADLTDPTVDSLD